MTRITFQGRLVGWLAALALFLLLSIIDDYAGWRFLLLAGGLILALSASWARLLAGGLSFNREMRFGWAQVGDRLEERFTLTNRAGIPTLWVEVQDHSTLPGYQPGIVTGLDSSGRSAWRSQGLCTRRGLYTLGPTRILTGDPLGLFLVEIEDSRQAQIMVTPPVVALPHILVAPGGQAGEGRPRRGSLDRTITAAGVRQYTPGDPLRHIHWPTSARKEALFTHTFENTPSGVWWVILDLNEAVQAGQGARSTEEHAVMLAASLADRGLRLNRPVGLLANGHPFTFLPPQPGDGQRWAILRALAGLRPGQRPLAELLERLGPTLSGQSSLVVITADMHSAWVEQLLPLVWKGAAPTLLLLDPTRFGQAAAQPENSLPDGKASPASGRNPPPLAGAAGAVGAVGAAGAAGAVGAAGAADDLPSSPQARFGLPGVAPPSAPTAAGLSAALTGYGLRSEIIGPDLLDNPSAQPGQRGKMRWRITPSGRAILESDDLKWRPLR